MRFIDQKEIYSATNNGLAIFEYYFPGKDLSNPKTSFKIREKEKTASARVSWYSGLYRITDFGNQGEINGMNAIDFVIWKESLLYYDALKFIESVIIRREVGAGDYKKPQYRPEYSYREMTPDDKKGRYNFTYKEKPTESDLQVIGRYVTEEILDMFNCRPVEQYEYCSQSKKLNRDVVHIFKATDDYPMFVFDYGNFQKLYKPRDPEKKHRFVYIGEKPKDIVYGLQNILDAEDEFIDEEKGDRLPPEGKDKAIVKDLYRCSGESDAMNLASIGCHVYWLNSESAEYGEGDSSFHNINSLCENHYQVMDLDTTGQREAIKKGLKYIDLYTIELPEWLKKRKDFRGNPCKDLKDFINVSGKNQDSTFTSFLVLKRRAKPMKFWTKTVDKNKGTTTYGINLEFYYWFLQANGFYSMDSNYHKKAGYCYARVNGKVVELIHPDNIKKIAKRFTKEWVRSQNQMDEIAILNKINSSNQISEANLQELKEVSYNFKNYDRNTEVLNFKNGSLKITKDKIERIKHEDLPNHILGKLEISRSNVVSHLIDRNIHVTKQQPVTIDPTPEYQALMAKYNAAKTDNERDAINAEISMFPELKRYKVTINDDKFIFTNFLRDLARLHWRKDIEDKAELSTDEKAEQDLALSNLMFLLGYHCSQYKDPAKPWLTYLQDMKISAVGKSSGRSGKSLISMAINYCRASFYIGGRKLNDKSQYQFLYDGLTEFHDFIEVDDFHEFGDFDFFYTQITGKREVNPKNLAPYTLSYEDSGKMLMSSNFELQNTNNSTIARILSAGVSDFYHESSKYNDYKETRSPFTKYGRNLYLDFTNEEWVKFYNFIAYCIQMQMRFHKIQPPMGNLEKRQLRREMAKGLGREEEFLTWAQSYFMPWNGSGEMPKHSPADQGIFNTYIMRENAFTAFKETLSEKQKRDYKAAQFKKHIVAFAEYYGLEFNPAKLCTNADETDPGKRRIMKKIDSKTQECFFISSRNERDKVENNHENDTGELTPEEENNLPF